MFVSETLCGSVADPAGEPSTEKNESGIGAKPGLSQGWEERYPYPGTTFMGTMGRFETGGSGCVADCKEWAVPQHWRINHLRFTEEEILAMARPDVEVEISSVMWSSEQYSQLRIRVGENGTFASLRPSRVPCSLPLASITPNRINLAALKSLPIPPSPELLDALSWIETDRVYRILRDHPKFRKVQSEARHHVSRHVIGDVEDLKAWGVLHPGKPMPFSMEIPIFKVAKAGGMEARLIADCRALNALLPRPGPMGLPTIREVLLALLSKNYLHQLDAKSFFYQFAIHWTLSFILTSRLGGKRGAFIFLLWLVMAMGLCFAPGVAQQSSLHIAKNVPKTSEETIIPWVDNFLFGTLGSKNMTSLLDRFENVRCIVNMEMKPADDKPGRTLLALGLFLDCSAEDVNDHWASLQPTFVENLKMAKETITGTMTPRDVYAIFGSIMWANHAIMHQPLARWGHILEHVRSISREIFLDQKKWDIHGTIPEQAQDDLRDMIEEALSAKVTLRDLLTPKYTEVLWSDASNAMMGYLRQAEGSVKGISRTYKGLTIYAAELLAGADALNSSTGTPLLMIDNQSALRSLIKGHSSVLAGNIILRRLWEETTAEQHRIAAWIQSACNRSDPLSRGYGMYPIFADFRDSHEGPLTNIQWTGKRAQRA